MTATTTTTPPRARHRKKALRRGKIGECIMAAGHTPHKGKIKMHIGYRIVAVVFIIQALVICMSAPKNGCVNAGCVKCVAFQMHTGEPKMWINISIRPSVRTFIYGWYDVPDRLLRIYAVCLWNAWTWNIVYVLVNSQRSDCLSACIVRVHAGRAVMFVRVLCLWMWFRLTSTYSRAVIAKTFRKNITANCDCGSVSLVRMLLLMLMLPCHCRFAICSL